MNTQWIPKEIAPELHRSVTDRENPFYGQVATLGIDGQPHVRTVHFRFADEYGTLGFSTHQRSPKWQELTRNPRMSGCYYDAKASRQWRWEGAVQLIAFESEPTPASALLTRFWNLIRPSIRETYWRESAHTAPADLNKRCPDVGAVICLPNVWEVLELHDEDYEKTTRLRYTWADGHWRKEHLSSVSSLVKI